MSDLTLTPPPAQFVTQETLRVAAIMARFDRRRLAAFVEVAIDLFDVADGDPEIEDNGDEMDGNASEDDFMHHDRADGPGCPIADSDVEHDGREQEDGM